MIFLLRILTLYLTISLNLSKYSPKTRYLVQLAPPSRQNNLRPTAPKEKVLNYTRQQPLERYVTLRIDRPKCAEQETTGRNWPFRCERLRKESLPRARRFALRNLHLRHRRPAREFDRIHAAGVFLAPIVIGIIARRSLGIGTANRFSSTRARAPLRARSRS